ncbi:sugar phosphate nucleotidyltransferase [Lachnospiraceae bacterium 56-18]|uniref:nucleotidyltransferase family protein n=1 Tax=Sporofaciens sp. JLR.KK001 TaxID=3112621 RepID=UPI002FF0C8ED
MLKTAVILAGGKGTRLRPYTVAIPKPLVPVAGKPILEIIIIQLAKQGFKRLIITVNHQADIIMAYFGDGRKWGIKIEYSLEDTPLGTMGPIKLVQDLPDYFLVMNGDVLSDIGYADFLERHIKSEKIFSIASFRRTQKNDYGILDVKDNILIGFREKPEVQFVVSMGIYAVSKKATEYIPADQYFGFDMLMNSFLEKKMEVAIYEHVGYWMDIGRPEDYTKADSDIEEGIFKY